MQFTCPARGEATSLHRASVLDRKADIVSLTLPVRGTCTTKKVPGRRVYDCIDARDILRRPVDRSVRYGALPCRDDSLRL